MPVVLLGKVMDLERSKVCLKESIVLISGLGAINVAFDYNSAVRYELVEPFPGQDHYVRGHASAKLGADGVGSVPLRGSAGRSYRDAGGLLKYRLQFFEGCRKASRHEDFDLCERSGWPGEKCRQGNH